MIIIDCPWCGTRSEDEFSFGGQAHVVRPNPSPATPDSWWASYLYDKINPKGVNYELWCHTFGCRQWLHVARDTVSDRVVAVYKPTDPRPEAGA